MLILYVYGTFATLSTGTMAGYMDPRYRASKGNESKGNEPLPMPMPMPQIRQIHICDNSDSNESFNEEGPKASLIKQEADFIDNGDDVTDKVVNKTN